MTNLEKRMEFLTTHEEKLKFSWDPGCGYTGNGNYFVGPIGPCGTPSPTVAGGHFGPTGSSGVSRCSCGSSPTGATSATGANSPTGAVARSEKKPFDEIPSAVLLGISLKENDPDLFRSFDRLIDELAQDKELKILQRPRVRFIIDRTLPKEEHLMKIEKIKKANETKSQMINNLIAQLEVLGCDCDDLDLHGTLEEIPREYYYNEGHDDYTNQLQICCHSGTALYRFLNEHGLLKKYYPEWYRKMMDGTCVWASG
jgi:hypothetical protein